MSKSTFDLKGFREHRLKKTQAEFAELLGISQDELSRMEQDPDEIPYKILKLIAEKTGVPIDDMISPEKPEPLKTIRTWSCAQYVKDTMTDYLRRAKPNGYDPKFEKWFTQLDTLISTSIRKPKIVFLGRSDSGKSTMINALIGEDKMPTSWTPTTSIVVYLKHIDDRPSFIKDELWIFRKGKDSELWDDSLLAEDKAAECRAWKIAGGSADMLASYGTREGDKYSQDDVGAAVLFVKSDILLNCDLMDAPGFAGGIESDNVAAKKAQLKADVLVYLSPANGFMTNEDIVCLKSGIKTLSAPEKKGENDAAPLANLFIVATQAQIINCGNPQEIRKILTKGSNNLFRELNKDFWSDRSAASGYTYTVEDMNARFFAYTTDIEEVRKPFESRLTELIEWMPSLIRDKAVGAIKRHCSEAGFAAEQEVAELEDTIADFDGKVKKLKWLLEHEPARKLDVMQKRELLLGKLKAHRAQSLADFERTYSSILCEDHIVSTIERQGYKSKKEDMQLLSSYIGSELEDSLKKILTGESERFRDEVENFIKDFQQSCDVRGAWVSGNGAEFFNAKRAFASGLTGVATLGALAIWASTLGNLGGYILVAKGVSILSALGISIAGGTAAAVSAVAAIGGPIVLGLALAVMAGLGALGLGSIGWKKKVAKEIREAYNKENTAGQLRQAIDTYWCDTESALCAAADQMEAEWQSNLADQRHTVENFDRVTIQERIKKWKAVRDFFKRNPLCSPALSK